MRPSDSQSDGKIEGGGEFINEAQSAMIFNLWIIFVWNFFWIFQRTFCFDFVLVKSYSIRQRLIVKLLEKSPNFKLTKVKIEYFSYEFHLTYDFIEHSHEDRMKWR